jgi:hypothetical protein
MNEDRTRLINGAVARREEVYEAIDGERAYQDSKWNPSTTSTGGRHENILEWLVYMKNYVEEAIHVMSREQEPEASEFALHTTRKVAGLAVSAMEQCGVRSRAQEGPRPIGADRRKK